MKKLDNKTNFKAMPGKWDITQGDFQSNVRKYAQQQTRKRRTTKLIYLGLFLIVLATISVAFFIMLSSARN